MASIILILYYLYYKNLRQTSRITMSYCQTPLEKRLLCKGFIKRTRDIIFVIHLTIYFAHRTVNHVITCFATLASLAI